MYAGCLINGCNELSKPNIKPTFLPGNCGRTFLPFRNCSSPNKTVFTASPLTWRKVSPQSLLSIYSSIQDISISLSNQSDTISMVPSPALSTANANSLISAELASVPGTYLPYISLCKIVLEVLNPNAPASIASVTSSAIFPISSLDAST